MSNLLLKSIFRIQYVSDLHLEKNFNNRSIIAKKPYLILAGDVGYPFENNYKNFLLHMSYIFDKVFIISGNHEYDFLRKDENINDRDLLINNTCASRNNLFFLQEQTHTICEKDNISIAGCTLWSKLPKSKHEYHLKHKLWLENIIKNNPNNNYIVATHHAPLFECLPSYSLNGTQNYFASDQKDIINNKNLLLWLHGHTHLNKNIIINGLNIVSNQYGSYEFPLKGYN